MTLLRIFKPAIICAVVFMLIAVVLVLSCNPKKTVKKEIKEDVITYTINLTNPTYEMLIENINEIQEKWHGDIDVKLEIYSSACIEFKIKENIEEMKNGPIDVDFIEKSTSKKDIELFLGPVDKEQEQVFFDLKDGMLIAHFMHQAGVFKSVSEARKNGWNKSIPEGFSTLL